MIEPGSVLERDLVQKLRAAIADCDEGSTVNLVTLLEIFSDRSKRPGSVHWN